MLMPRPPLWLQMVRLFRQLQLIRLFKQLEVRQRLKRALAAAEALPPEALGGEAGLAAVEARVMAKYQGGQSRVGQRLSGGDAAAGREALTAVLQQVGLEDAML
jgi:hypothetical protein